MNKIAEKIIRDCAWQSGSTVARIKGRMRTPRLVILRSHCMREVLIRTDLSMGEVGEIFGNRGRTTVLRLLKQLKPRSAKRFGWAK